MSHRVLLLTTVALLAAAPAARAGTTVSFVSDVVTVVNDDGPSAISNKDFYFTDIGFQDELGGMVTAGAGCAQVTMTSVSCGTYGPATRLSVSLGGGDDRYKVTAINAPGDIDGGPGNDSFEAGDRADRIRGGAGNDDIDGLQGDDDVDGGEGDDTVDGGAGNDTVAGGPGKDVLLGDGETLYANGNDTILARDGAADSVDCGGGADTAQTDGADVISGCEQVDKGTTPTPTPTSGPGGTLSVATAVTKVPALGRVRKGSAVGVRLTASAACTARVALAVSKRVAKQLGVGKQATTIGASAIVALPAGVPTALTVAVKKSVRRHLKGRRKVSAAVVVVCANEAGEQFSDAVALKLRA